MLNEHTIAGRVVSRETWEVLTRFAALVRRWNPAINLVSRASVPELWQRHIVDSAQLFGFCPAGARSWVDLGSGGGFPGLVIAILAGEGMPGLKVTLVESDARKATFLRQAAVALSVSADVRCARIEALEPMCADVISARALAPLSELIGHAHRHLGTEGLAIFPKGARFSEEVADARKMWSFDLELKGSLSDPDAAIVMIRKIRRAEQ